MASADTRSTRVRVVVVDRVRQSIKKSGASAKKTLGRPSLRLVIPIPQLARAVPIDRGSDDPLFVDEQGRDFGLEAGSPALGGGNDAIVALDAEYKATFGDGVSIIPECWAEGTYDIGASCG